MTWNVSPGGGSDERPSTSTGVDGPAVLTLRPEVIEQRAHLAVDRAGDEQVAFAERAVLHEHASRPGRGPRSSFASSTVPCAIRFGLALRSAMSATSRIISSS